LCLWAQPALLYGLRLERHFLTGFIVVFTIFIEVLTSFNTALPFLFFTRVQFDHLGRSRTGEACSGGK
jgi:hypothetical protein